MKHCLVSAPGVQDPLAILTKCTASLRQRLAAQAGLRKAAVGWVPANISPARTNHQVTDRERESAAMIRMWAHRGDRVSGEMPINILFERSVRKKDKGNWTPNDLCVETHLILRSCPKYLFWIKIIWLNFWRCRLKSWHHFTCLLGWALLFDQDSSTEKRWVALCL